MSKSTSTDDLVKKARLLQEQSRLSREAEANQPKGFFDKHIGDLGKHREIPGTDKVEGALSKVWEKTIAPMAEWYWGKCKNTFNKYSHDKEGAFKVARAAVVGAAIVGVTGMGMMGGYHATVNALPFAVKTGYEAVVIENFAYHETRLFSKPVVIDGKENIWSVSSCDKYPCKGQVDSVEYRMQDSNWLDVKKLFTDFQPHDPGELQGAFSSENSVCNVEVYSQRLKLPFVSTSIGLYPKIIDATCMPVDGGNWAEMLDMMKDQRLDIGQQVQGQEVSYLGHATHNLNSPTLPALG